MARSRGADAVQAATARAPAAAPAAVAPDEDAANMRNDREGTIDFSFEMFSPVLNLKGLCAIHPSAGEPIHYLSLLMQPEGKCVRVPNCPRMFVTVADAKWKCVEFPCWVVFDVKTKRKDCELAVCVCDYHHLDPSIDLMSVESLMQPLRFCNNVCRTATSEQRNTRFCDVKGFRSIGSTVDEAEIVSPWTENFQMYKELDIGNHKDSPTTFIASPLRDRFETILDLSAKHAHDLTQPLHNMLRIVLHENPM
eukprot:1154334-Pleurochrysis_carterae.AAC.1